MKKPDEKKCTSTAENVEVFCNNFAQLYEKQPTNRDSINKQLNQLPIHPEMDDLTTDKEINLAIQKLNNSAAGAFWIKAEIYKALATNPKTFSTIQRITHNFWMEEKQPEEFNYGRLGILPQKGDLSEPGNYRGIMMLEVGQTIISNITGIRLAPFVEEFNHELKCGLRPKRGMGDAIFTLKMALKKRKEHNLESWVLSIDFVKEFDQVPREPLWKN